MLYQEALETVNIILLKSQKYIWRKSKKLGYKFVERITQSKDSCYRQHEPDNMSSAKILKERWEACKFGNVMTSEMESTAIFVISSIRKCRASLIMLYKDMKRTMEVAQEELIILLTEDIKK